jgi:hypothetical protein
MKVQRFWSGHAHVYPWHLVPAPTPDGAERKSRRYATGAEQWEGVVRVLQHAGARRIVESVNAHLRAPVVIVCAVPRLSDDFDADYARVDRFIGAVFFGEPTEGLDAAPPAPEASA